ncbi:MAG: hypothetical protein M1817_003139 [Caeruleum heppii]|nr:MAG: hypothetical protein M1817_003139 [Caeruleum heppii]
MALIPGFSPEVFIQELSNTSRVYTLEDAAFTFTRYNGTALETEGCLAPSWDPNRGRTCSEACQDVRQVFGSPQTFQNCLALPTLVNHLASSNASSVDRAIASAYGISRDHLRISGNVVGTVTKCFGNYIDSLPDDLSVNGLRKSLPGAPIPAVDTVDTLLADKGPDALRDACSPLLAASSSTRSFDIRSGSGEDEPHQRPTSTCIRTLCRVATSRATVNFDIAGIGVYISYFIQAACTLVGWTLLNMWDICLYWLRRQQKDESDRAEAGRARDRSDMLREYQDRLIEALFEFHKAQCFFTLAIQIAALIVIHSNSFEAATLQDISNNYAFLSVLSWGGHVPITFLLLTLRGVGLDSWYLLSLSTCTVGVTTATFASTGHVRPLSNFKPSQYPDCAALNPVAFCLHSGPTAGRYVANAFSGGLVLALSISFLSILIIFRVYADARRLDPSKWRWAVCFRKGPYFDDDGKLKSFKRPLSTNQPNRSVYVHVPCFVATLLLAFVFGPYLQELRDQWSRTSVKNISDLSGWSFGQIVAITVWVPSLLQYLYLSIRQLLTPADPACIVDVLTTEPEQMAWQVIDTTYLDVGESFETPVVKSIPTALLRQVTCLRRLTPTTPALSSVT